jgi:hypothetical protein
MVSWNGYTIATRPREIRKGCVGAEIVVLNMGETDSSRVPMATDGPDVTDEALLERLGLRRHCTFKNRNFYS